MDLEIEKRKEKRNIECPYFVYLARVFQVANLRIIAPRKLTKREIRRERERERERECVCVCERERERKREREKLREEK